MKMASEDLAEVVQRLHVSTTCDSIDTILHEAKGRRRQKHDPAKLRAEFERKYLQPPAGLATEWLDRLQQRWDTPVDYQLLFEVAPTQTRSVTRFLRKGLEGRPCGYYDVTVPAPRATAKNSTSLSRRPGDRAEFVRGAAGFFPFAPGGLTGPEPVAVLGCSIAREDVVAVDGPSRRKLDRIIRLGSEKVMLEVAPGLSRGIVLLSMNAAERDGNQGAQGMQREIEAVLDEEPADAPPRSDDREADSDEAQHQEVEDATEGQHGGINDDQSMDDDVDALLPVEFPALEPRGNLAAARHRAGKEWAHMVDVDGDMSNFAELVPEMAREWPFELDTFQKEAIYHLENSDSVFVAAHTSAGKTVVAEYAIALAAKHMTKAIYTSPIKALSNQKFRDFRQAFDDVGILTGDVQINPEASCLIMTTEILRSMLYRGADLIRDVEFVVFDEVHYVNDLERGVVWEEVIIMLPDHVTLVLLSATVPNTFEFASWVGRTKQKDMYVISTPKRPVPLEHFLWAGRDMYKIVDETKRFLEKGWKDAHAALQRRPDAPPAPGAAAGGGREHAREPRGGGRGGARGSRGQQQHQQQRGRAGPPRASHSPGHMGRQTRTGGVTTRARDSNLWVHMVHHLRKSNLLPACIFVFSKKRCEENADALSNQDFCTASEKHAVHVVVQRSVARLKPEDRTLPQIVRLREMLSRGVAVHHGGLLPIVKELVEILFAQTLVKVLFATETFAMGLNLPTRTVVFSGYRKHDGHSFRNLLPGEYTQMAGRAGRRGLDSVGTVIIAPPSNDEAPPVADLRQMMLGEPSKLRSQFRLTYNMILNLVRVEALKIEEMIKRSFSEHATQQLLPEHEEAVKVSEADLARIKRDSCLVCDPYMDECHQAAEDYKRLTGQLYQAMLAIPVGRRMFSTGRLVVWMKEGVRTPGILLADGPSVKSQSASPAVHLLEIRTTRETRNDTDMLPFVRGFREMLSPLVSSPLTAKAMAKAKKDMAFRACHVPVADVVCLTKHMPKGIIPSIWSKGDEQQAAKDKLRELCCPWKDELWDEVDLSRFTSLQLHELRAKRKAAAAKAAASPALACPRFLKHFAMCHDQWLIQTHIDQLRHTLSEQNLQLLPDYEQRLQVLKDLDFIDEASRIQLKGKVACEIHSSDELVLTELILENVLADYEPAEIAALLSAFVFQEKTSLEPHLTANLERAKQTIIDISEKVNKVQTQHQILQSTAESNDFASNPRFGLVEVVYEWARGMSFKNIMGLTDVLEGTIVRTITRLDETCREVRSAARIIGDPALYHKMVTAQELIKRDITAVASLYM